MERAREFAFRNSLRVFLGRAIKRKGSLIVESPFSRPPKPRPFAFFLFFVRLIFFFLPLSRVTGAGISIFRSLKIFELANQEVRGCST